MTPGPTYNFQKKKVTHGLTTLKKAIRVLGGRAIDRRTALGRVLEHWRHSLLSDLGAIEQTSAQQRQLIDLAVKTKLLLDSIDTWLVKQPSLVNHRKRALLPVVLQRQQLADALARYMTQLGLERKAKQVLSLSDYLTKGKDSDKQQSEDTTGRSHHKEISHDEHCDATHANPT